MTEFSSIIIWIGNTVASIAIMLDSVYVIDSGFTVLDWMLAFMYLNLIVWFIKEILKAPQDDDYEED